MTGPNVTMLLRLLLRGALSLLLLIGVVHLFALIGARNPLLVADDEDLRVEAGQPPEGPHDELREMAADPVRHKAFLMKASLLESVRRAIRA